MQRINYFPNPNFIPTGAHSSANGKDISKYFVNHTFANTSGNDIDLPFQDYKAGVEYVCTVRVKADSSNGRRLAVWGISNALSVASSGGVGVKTLRFVATQNTRLAVPSGVTIDGLCVERADTYDAAVGGASGLLHRGHDAARIGASVGRVMSDDGHEPVCDAALGLRFAAGRQHAYGVYGHGRRGLLFPRLGVLRWGHGEADDRRYDANLQPRRESHREIHAEIIESDCQHEGRVRRSESGARGLLRLRKLCAHDRRIPKVWDRGPLQREYDAARLTLMGAMA